MCEWSHNCPHSLKGPRTIAVEAQSSSPPRSDLSLGEEHRPSSSCSSRATPLIRRSERSPKGGAKNLAPEPHDGQITSRTRFFGSPAPRSLAHL